MLKAWQEWRYNRYNSEEDVEVPTSVMVRGGGGERTNCGVHAMGADTAGLAVCMCVCVFA